MSQTTDASTVSIVSTTTCSESGHEECEEWLAHLSTPSPISTVSSFEMPSCFETPSPIRIPHHHPPHIINPLHLKVPPHLINPPHIKPPRLASTRAPATTASKSSKYKIEFCQCDTFVDPCGYCKVVPDSQEGAHSSV